MNARTLQALLTKRPNQFGPEKVYVLARTDDGLEIGILRADETKDRLSITMGEIIELGGEKWRVGFILPGVDIPAQGDTTAVPRSIVQLELTA